MGYTDDGRFLLLLLLFKLRVWITIKQFAVLVTAKLAQKPTMAITMPFQGFSRINPLLSLTFYGREAQRVLLSLVLPAMNSWTKFLMPEVSCQSGSPKG